MLKHKWSLSLLLLTLLLTIQCQHLDKHVSQLFQTSKSDMTIVTGLWYIKGRNRKLQTYYFPFLKRVLQCEDNMIIFGDQEVKNFTMKYRTRQNTKFIVKNFSTIEEFWYSNKMGSSNNQKTKKWFKDNLYNNIVFKKNQYLTVIFSKMYLMKQAIKINPFQTNHFTWTDPSTFHIVRPRNATVRNSKRNSISMIGNIIKQPFWFRTYLSTDLDDASELRYAPFLEAIRGDATIFGGITNQFLTGVNIYQNLVNILIHNNDVFTEEASFRYLIFRFKYLVSYADRPDLGSVVSTDFQGRIARPSIFIRKQSYRVSFPKQNEVQKADFKIFQEQQYDNYTRILTKNERYSFIIQKAGSTACGVILVFLIFLILSKFEKFVQ